MYICDATHKLLRLYALWFLERRFLKVSIDLVLQQTGIIVEQPSEGPYKNH